MRYQVVLARSALEQFKQLDARWRSSLKSSLKTFLESEPTKESRSRIKRLSGVKRPQYRLRVDAMRVFYDVDDRERRVEILAFVLKPDTEEWLLQHGVTE